MEFVLDEFGPIQASQQNKVHLKVEMRNTDMQTSAALLDGLVWSTHLSTLTIIGDCHNIVKVLPLAHVNRCLRLSTSV